MLFGGVMVISTNIPVFKKSTTEPGILVRSPDLDSWNLLFKLKVDG